MGKLSSLLWGAAIGAGMMYFMDPQNGDRRKAMVRDQVTRLQNKGDDALNTATNDLRHRVRGLLAEGMAMVDEKNAPDMVIEERIRSRLGFLSRHPGAIQVRVQNHRAVLTGDILANEIDNLVKGISHVRGVQDVQNDLTVHQEAGNIPQLQGEGWLPGDNGGQWSPSTRLLATAGAGYLLLYGLARGGLIGFFAKAGGVALGARALSNMDMRSMVGQSQEGNAVRVRKSITINAPVDEVYALWSNFENFPRFMNNIESIHNTGDGRSHWVVKGPAGSKVEFDAIETENRPNEIIAWRTMPDSTVKHQGQVRFAQQNGGTVVHVNMTYTPPAGIAGAAVAALFGKDPKSQMDSDLARMKSLLEEGKTTAKSEKVNRQEVMPVTGGQQGSSRSGRSRGSRGSSGDSGGSMGSGDDNIPVTGGTGSDMDLGDSLQDNDLMSGDMGSGMDMGGSQDDEDFRPLSTTDL